MPSLKASAVPIDPAQYRPVQPMPAPHMPLPPIMPAHMLPSPVMISSLPAVSTTVEGITRQFFGRGTLPIRRIATPGKAI